MTNKWIKTNNSEEYATQTQTTEILYVENRFSLKISSQWNEFLCCYCSKSTDTSLSSKSIIWDENGEENE